LRYAASFALYWSRRSELSSSNAPFLKKHGCKPVYRIPQTERIIGYSYFKEQVAAAKDKRFLETLTKRYQKYGSTWSATAMGRVFINTIDPDNIKAILATNFGDFGLGHRMRTFGPLLGKGIFTTDGAAWEHSRVCAILLCSLSNEKESLYLPPRSLSPGYELESGGRVHLQR
jgi:hypothetical protein